MQETLSLEKPYFTMLNAQGIYELETAIRPKFKHKIVFCLSVSIKNLN